MGTGPLFNLLNQYVISNNLYWIKLFGFKTGQELTDIIGNTKCVILPSEWYENGPYSAIEALQLGKPIIGSDIGGIPELIKDNGFVFRSGSVDGLIQSVNKMEQVSRDDYLKMVMASHSIFNMTYTANRHYPLILKAYSKALRCK